MNTPHPCIHRTMLLSARRRMLLSKGSPFPAAMGTRSGKPSCNCSNDMRSAEQAIDGLPCLTLLLCRSWRGTARPL